METVMMRCPVRSTSIDLFNEPSTVIVKKVSASDSSKVVPNTEFVGWKTNDEADMDEAFAVFAEEGVEISSASIDYLGEFSQVGSQEVKDSFELSEVNANGYDTFAADKAAEQGDYVLHVTYSSDGKETSDDIPFSINEYDKNAYFAIGKNIVKSGDKANSFAISGTADDDAGEATAPR